MCGVYYHTIIHENLSIYVNINSTLNRNVLSHEHAQEHLGTIILLTRQLCSVRSGIMSIVLFSCG